MNDKMRKASQLVIGGALCLSLVTGVRRCLIPRLPSASLR